MTAINPKAVRGPVTAVPVVAGHGVRFVEDVPNNRVVAEADETVLWENSEGKTPSVTGDFPLTLSEPITNFETVKFYWQTFSENDKNHTVSEKMTDLTSITLEGFIYNPSNDGVFSLLWGLSIVGTTVSHVIAKYNGWANNNVNPAGAFVRLFKVVGVNRIASN